MKKIVIETSLIQNVETKVEEAICFEPNNPNFNVMSVNIFIPVFAFQISEFQILILIDFLTNMIRDGNNLDRKIAELQKLESRTNVPIDNIKKEVKNIRERKRAVYDNFVH